ncbi:hypothetical protein EGW08_018264 [Elysia chlorotica]|uniref:Uncharacterized protein n=1 Tax=Elysia chlorotica TaxID=188477 RepID=A0A3S1B3A5_ELYCH|nr:hypothetical protein EGW08_018264 [Elysia chlorotica]
MISQIGEALGQVCMSVIQCLAWCTWWEATGCLLSSAWLGATGGKQLDVCYPVLGLVQLVGSNWMSVIQCLAWCSWWEATVCLLSSAWLGAAGGKQLDVCYPVLGSASW